MQKFGNVFILFVGFFIGLGVFYSAFNSPLQVREVAASQQKIYQIDNLTNDEIKNQLVKKIRINATDSGVKHIKFTGFSSSICQAFPNIEVEMVAEGISVAGEPPSLKINFPCAQGQDPSEMASLKIPIEKLLLEKARNAEFKFDGFDAKITSFNSADEWPRQWVLKRIAFLNSASVAAKEANFSRGPASTETSKPVIIEF